MDLEQSLDSLLNVINMINRLGEISNTSVTILSAILSLCAIIQCLYGFKLTKLLISIYGSVIGALLSIPVIGLIIKAINIQYSNIIILEVLLFAIAGGYIAFKVYKLGIFILSGFIPFLFVLMLNSILGDATFIVAFAVYLVFGTIGVLITKPYIIFVTSIGNGILAGIYILSTFRITNIGASILIGGILSIIGIIFQFKTTQKVEAKANENVETVQNINKNDTSRIIASSVTLSILTVIANTLIVQGILYGIILILLGAVLTVVFNIISFRKAIECENYKLYTIIYTLSFVVANILTLGFSGIICSTFFIAGVFLRYKLNNYKYDKIYYIAIPLLQIIFRLMSLGAYLIYLF